MDFQTSVERRTHTTNGHLADVDLPGILETISFLQRELGEPRTDEENAILWQTPAGSFVGVQICFAHPKMPVKFVVRHVRDGKLRGGSSRPARARNARSFYWSAGVLG